MLHGGVTCGRQLSLLLPTWSSFFSLFAFVHFMSIIQGHTGLQGCRNQFLPLTVTHPTNIGGSREKMDAISCCSYYLNNLDGAMTCTEMIDCKAERIQVSSQEASLKDCGCLGRAGMSSRKAYKGRSIWKVGRIQTRRDGQGQYRP